MRTSKLTHKEIAARFHGISRNMIQHVMLNIFHPGQDYRECFTYLRIQYMPGSTFISYLRDGRLAYPFRDQTYAIIYQGCTPYHVKRAHEIVCSYREAIPELNLEPVVIVRIVKEREL